MVKNILNYNRSKPEFLRFLWDIVVFRLVADLLNMICLDLLFLSKLYIYEFAYKFDTVLYKFLETGTSDKTFMGRDQELKWLAFRLYPLSFFLDCPSNDFSMPYIQVFQAKNWFFFECGFLKMEAHLKLHLYIYI